MRRGIITFLIGLLLGTAVGLYLGWFAYPVEWVDVLPAELSEEDQIDYLALIAATYAAEQNLLNAQQRLAQLGRDEWRPWVLTHTVDAVLTDPRSLQTAQLVQLALDLGLNSPAFTPYQTASDPDSENSGAEQDG